MITITAIAPANMYFRLRNSVDEAGISLLIESYKVIRETPHFALCILHYAYGLIDGSDYANMTEKELRYRFGRSFKRIHKTASRFAFPTLEDAVKNFEYRKSQQFRLLQNQLNEITLLRKSSAEKTCNLPIGKKPRIRIYSDDRMELMNSFMYWSQDLEWFICESYVNYYNSLRNL